MGLLGEIGGLYFLCPIAHDLEIGVNQVNVKATTTEGLSFAGREEGITVHAVVLLKELSK